MQSQFSAEIRLMQDRVDGTTADIQDVSSQQKGFSAQTETQQGQTRARQDRKRRNQNLRRAVMDMRERILSKSNRMNGEAGMTLPLLSIGDADADFARQDSSNHAQDPATLNAGLPVYKGLNASLAAHFTSLKARDTELESKYRKVVALCTGVEENKVDSVLPQLVQAVESEPENDVGRVREFLKRVEAVAGAS